MHKLKRSTVVALGMAAALAASVVTSSPAMAASSPITVCGGGSYHVIDSHALGSYATIYLLYNGSTNCVVTVKKGAYAGNTKYVDAYLTRSDLNYTKIDHGYFKYYAGPVKISAAGKCVKWGGVYDAQGWTSGWGHCN
ncbi:spore-associated protein A [Streptosporangium sp. NBC_01756]|uniref:spore-associated protein A n=1 Tax=Streptosporangium sp. NBC_01756 TaxID=2975950 RepID=UPI002DD8F37B|nr:spore-associated protein A [Streptosporangium sp. NBC_01756]WSC83443.1 spore-associated protein A [Streptosporangium sp. NBC_01756]